MDGIISLHVNYRIAQEVFTHEKYDVKKQTFKILANKLAKQMLEHNLIKIREEKDPYHNTRNFIGTIHVADMEKLRVPDVIEKIEVIHLPINPSPQDFIKAEQTARKNGYKEGVRAFLEALQECWDTDKDIEAFLKEFHALLDEKIEIVKV